MTLPSTIPDLERYLTEHFMVEESHSALNSAMEDHVEFYCCAATSRTAEAMICETLGAFACAQHQDGAKWSWRVKPELGVRDSDTGVPLHIAYARGSVVHGRPLKKVDVEHLRKLGAAHIPLTAKAA